MSRLLALLLLLLTSPLFAETPRLDAFGDPLPTGVTKRLGTQRFRSAGNVTIALSPDGKMLATGESETIHLWDMATGREVRSIAFKQRPNPDGSASDLRAHLNIQAIVFSPDGKRVAAVGRNALMSRDLHSKDSYAFFLAEIATGKVLIQNWKVEDSPLLPVFFADGKLLMVDRPFLTFWSDTPMNPPIALAGVNSYALSPDGKRLAVADKEGPVGLWDFDLVLKMSPFDEQMRCASAMAFSPNGRLLAVATNAMKKKGADGPVDRTIRLCDVESGEELLRLDGLADGIDSLQFSADGKTLLARGNGPRLFLWDVATGRRLTSLPEKERLTAAAHAFSPDGGLLAWVETDTGVQGHVLDAWNPNYHREQSPMVLWDIAPEKEVRRWPAQQCEAAPLCFTPDGKTLIAGGSSLVMWEVATGRELPHFTGHRIWLRSVSYSPDGTRLASLDYNGRLLLWDTTAGERLALRFPCADKETLDHHFSADGTELIAVGPHYVHVWQTTDGRLLRSWPIKNADGSAIFSNDRRLLATFVFPNTGLHLWEVSTGKQINTPPIRVWEMSFSPTGRYLAAQSGHEVLDIYDCATGRHRGFFKAQSPGEEYVGGKIAPRSVRCAFSPNDGLLSWCDGKEVCVWDLKRGRELWRTNGQKISFPDLAFSADGKTLLCCGESDRTLRVWDAASGKELRRQGIGDGERAASWTAPDGRLLVRIRRLGCPEQPSFQDPLTGRKVPCWTIEPWWLKPTWSPDKRIAVTLALTIFAGPDGRVLARLPHPKPWVNTLTFSPDGKTLATSDNDGTILLWDVSGLKGRWPPQLVTYPAAELDSLWQRLASKESREEAMHELLASPRQAVPFLRARLRTVPVPDLPRLRRQIANLNSDDFEERESATRELIQFGKLAESDLRKTLARKPTPEVKRRIVELFEYYRIVEDPSPKVLQVTAALRVLELLANGAAK